MKNLREIKIALFALLVVTCSTSCLKKDLEELPLWDTNEIVSINANYRFLNPNRIRNNEPVVEEQSITVISQIDKVNAIITVQLNVPGPNTAINFTAAERNNVVQSKLWFSANISPAAKISPIDGTPKLGDPTDATKPLKYIVTAANGAARTWTINVTAFNK